MGSTTCPVATNRSDVLTPVDDVFFSEGVSTESPFRADVPLVVVGEPLMVRSLLPSEAGL